MPVTNGSTLSTFDADGALTAVRRTISGPLYSFCEYDTTSFRPLYVDDRTLGMYEDREEMVDHFERIHANVHMDFMEINLFKNTLFPAAEHVEYIVTAMDFLKIVRVYVDDQGLFIALSADEPVEPVVEAIKEAVGWPPKGNY